MDFNATIDLIIRDLDEAREIIDDLKKYPGVPALQVELAKSKCKSAGEVIALLKTLQKYVPKEEKNLQATEFPERKATPVKKDTPYHIKVLTPVPPVLEIIVPDSIEIKSTESTIIADTFSRSEDNFNEKLGRLKNEEDFSKILKTMPLSNLFEAIGVNDRFLFIREIFKGNKDAYSQAIARLNITENITDARAVIMSYTGDNNGNEATEQLLDLVKRKLL